MAFSIRLKIHGFFNRKFPFHLILLPELPKFSVQCFAFLKIDNSVTFPHNGGIHIFFASIWKVQEFKLECKGPSYAINGNPRRKMDLIQQLLMAINKKRAYRILVKV